ncbi:hypothetical protein [Burkholderia cenocepacia]|uniref:hypothetical protein n=1 Tax=Burkholderia cenocepacia TaxID=95486 RepID=UPI00076219E5|nr:hypothetical protein [Burkholderia cenocepacia]KWU26375.1 hypothetical protein AS149_25640 [Burkholderia cenocepacia]
MSTIHVVLGRTGEYADRHEWHVGASTDETVAQATAEQLNDTARRFNALMGECEESNALSDDAALRNALGEAGDRLCGVIDYTGVRYRCVTVPLMSQ